METAHEGAVEPGNSAGTLNMSAPATLDPSRSSYYVNDVLYRELVEAFSGWQDDTRAVTDVTIRDQLRRLLEREARLLDQLHYEDWLAMYASQCIYWVPSTPVAGGPRRENLGMF